MLLSIFLLFNSLYVIPYVQQPDILSDNEESVSFYTVNINSTGAQSFFNEEESDDTEKDCLASIEHVFYFNYNVFIIDTVECKSDRHSQQFIYVLQSDLPPPAFI